jgi:ubiquinone/menaquinone biosynthesis C-methylase UbiE
MGPLLEEIRKRIPETGPLIDVGVGTGRFAQPLKEMGLDVVGIDVSRGMIANAREKGAGGLVYADVRRIPFRSRRFHSALLVHVLHLVDDWQDVVSESARVARSNVMTVLESRRGLDLRAEYQELRARLGHRVIRFGEGELTKRVKPASVVTVARTSRTVVADAEIQHLAERGQSIRWEVPEEVHSEIIDELRSAYTGEEFRSTGKLELAVWRASQLRDLKAPPKSRGLVGSVTSSSEGTSPLK